MIHAATFCVAATMLQENISKVDGNGCNRKLVLSPQKKSKAQPNCKRWKIVCEPALNGNRAKTNASACDELSHLFKFPIGKRRA